MRLYDVKTAPSPRRVRIFLAEKKINVEVIQVNTAEGQHLKEDFLKLNPWATVPVLELDDGTCISEAIACCRYLEEVHPNPPLMGVDPSEKAIISMWEHRMEWDGFLPVAELLRNTVERLKNRGLTGTLNFSQIPALAERGRKRIAHFHDFLDKRLAESKFVATDKYSIADITAQVSIDFAQRAGVPVQEDKKNILRWHSNVNSRESAKA
ncbi:MAG: glutathione S-transferase family protein [Rhodospirillaceae bacterium]|nr:glutathione S-transferase family protein [Rhodospirillaceae bacterium]